MDVAPLCLLHTVACVCLRRPALVCLVHFAHPVRATVASFSTLLISVRLVSLATQHFLYDVMTDARQFQRLRSQEKKDSNVRHTTIDPGSVGRIAS